MTPKSDLSRVGGAGAGDAPFSFDRGDEGGLFTTDKGPGPDTDMDIEAKFGVKEVGTEKMVAPSPG